MTGWLIAWCVTATLLLALTTSRMLLWMRRANEAQGLLTLSQAAKRWQQPDNTGTQYRRTIVRLAANLTEAQEAFKVLGPYVGVEDENYPLLVRTVENLTATLAKADLVKEYGIFEPSTAQVCAALNYLGPAAVTLRLPPQVDGGEVKDRTIHTTLERLWSSEQLAVFIRECVRAAQMPQDHPTAHFPLDFYERIDETRESRLYGKRAPNAKTLHERARKAGAQTNG